MNRSNYKFMGGRLRSAPCIQWQPRLYQHDPNPPMTLEDTDFIAWANATAFANPAATFNSATMATAFASTVTHGDAGYLGQQQALTAAITAAISEAGFLDQQQTLVAAITTAISEAGYLNQQQALTAAITAAISETQSANVQAAFAAAIATAINEAGYLDQQQVLAVAANAALSENGAQDLFPTMTLAVGAGYAITITLDLTVAHALESALSLATAGDIVSGSGQTYNEALALALSSAITMLGSRDGFPVFTVSVNPDFAPAVTHGITSMLTCNFTADFATTQDAALAARVMFIAQAVISGVANGALTAAQQFNSSPALIGLDTLNFFEVLSFAVLNALTTALKEVLIGQPFVRVGPEDRDYRISKEKRVYVVSWENRTFRVKR